MEENTQIQDSIVSEVPEEAATVEGQSSNSPISRFNKLLLWHKTLLILLGVLLLLGIPLGIFLAFHSTKTPASLKKNTEPSVVPTSSPSAVPTLDVQSQLSPTPTGVFKVEVNVLGNSTPTPTGHSNPTSVPQSQISIGVGGTVFSDDNCNGTKDSNEQTLSNVSVSVYYNNPPVFQDVGDLTTDSGGSFNWSKSIDANSSYPVQITALSPSGYKSDPRQGAYSVILNASNPHASWDIGQVPNDKVSSMCNN